MGRLLSHESRMMDRKLRRICGRKWEAVTRGYSKKIKANSIICRHNSRVQIEGHETGGISSTNEGEKKCIQNFYRAI